MLEISRSAMPCGVVVAAIDPAVHLRDRQVDLVLAEFRLGHHFLKDAQHRAGGFLEAGKTDAGVGFAHARFDRRRDVLQFLVDLIAGLGVRAAGAQNIRHHATTARAYPADRTDCRCAPAPAR